MASVRGRVRPASIAAVAVWTLSCGSDGSEPVTRTTSPVVSVLVSPSFVPLNVRGTQQLTATPLDASGAPVLGRSISWATRNALVATVSASGLVTAVDSGTTTVTATSDGQSGSALVSVAAPPPATVAQVIVTPPSPSVLVGRSQQLNATTLDATGATLSGRAVAWASSDVSVATVSTSGVARGVAAGTVTITAISEGKSGTVSLTSANPPQGVILTGIYEPASFVNLCPTSDPAYATIRQDFELRSDGPIDSVAVTCTDPYNTVPTAQLTDELLVEQTFRMAYYMGQGTAGKLPWTSLSLYDWMKSQIAGIEFSTAPGGGSSCCAVFFGKKYVVLPRMAAASLNGYRDWNAVAGWLALLAHETRHAAGYPHVNGCPAFPLPTDPLGCDPTYDINNLGAYGIQYWLFSNWASGALNVGIACASPTDAKAMAQNSASTANVYPSRFVQNAPPTVTATAPFGGVCYPP